MGKSEEQKLIDFLNWYNPDGTYNVMIVHEYLKASQSPTEPDALSHLPRLTLEQRDGIALQIDDYDLFEDLPEFDTLQEGDWFQGTDEEYRKVFELERSHNHSFMFDEWANNCLVSDCCCFDGHGITWCCDKKTQLTPEEFLRRADNTFKNK